MSSCQSRDPICPAAVGGSRDTSVSRNGSFYKDLERELIRVDRRVADACKYAFLAFPSAPKCHDVIVQRLDYTVEAEVMPTGLVFLKGGEVIYKIVWKLPFNGAIWDFYLDKTRVGINVSGGPVLDARNKAEQILNLYHEKKHEAGVQG